MLLKSLGGICKRRKLPSERDTNQVQLDKISKLLEEKSEASDKLAIEIVNSPDFLVDNRAGPYGANELHLACQNDRFIVAKALV